MSSHDLTQKQMEVVRLAAAGYCVKQTARELGVSIDVIKDRRTAVARKLAAKNITHAVHIATLRGWVVEAA